MMKFDGYDDEIPSEAEYCHTLWSGAKSCDWKA